MTKLRYRSKPTYDELQKLLHDAERAAALYKRQMTRLEEELAFERQAQHRRARDQAWAH